MAVAGVISAVGMKRAGPVLRKVHVVAVVADVAVVAVSVRGIVVEVAMKDRIGAIRGPVPRIRAIVPKGILIVPSNRVF
jgi:hypothetical protein